jgi:hypothetical protein
MPFNCHLRHIALDSISMYERVRDILDHATSLQTLELTNCYMVVPGNEQQPGATMRELELQRLTDAVTKNSTLRKLVLYSLQEEESEITFNHENSNLEELSCSCPDDNICPSLSSLILRCSTLHQLELVQFHFDEEQMGALCQAMTCPTRKSNINTIFINECKFWIWKTCVCFELWW